MCGRYLEVEEHHPKFISACLAACLVRQGQAFQVSLIYFIFVVHAIKSNEEFKNNKFQV